MLYFRFRCGAPQRILPGSGCIISFTFGNPRWGWMSSGTKCRRFIETSLLCCFASGATLDAVLFAQKELGLGVPEFFSDCGGKFSHLRIQRNRRDWVLRAVVRRPSKINVKENGALPTLHYRTSIAYHDCRRLCTKVRVLSLFVRISNHVDWRCSLSYPASTAGLASAPFSAPVPRGIAATTAQVRSGR